MRTLQPLLAALFYTLVDGGILMSPPQTGGGLMQGTGIGSFQPGAGSPPGTGQGGPPPTGGGLMQGTGVGSFQPGAGPPPGTNQGGPPPTGGGLVPVAGGGSFQPGTNQDGQGGPPPTGGSLVPVAEGGSFAPGTRQGGPPPTGGGLVPVAGGGSFAPGTGVGGGLQSGVGNQQTVAVGSSQALGGGVVPTVSEAKITKPEQVAFGLALPTSFAFDAAVVPDIAGGGSVDMAGAGGGQVQFVDVFSTECARLGCVGTCYIPHPTSCFNFIVCQQSPTGGFYAKVMPCAFGTMWRVGGEPACDIPKLVGCQNDPCRRHTTISYKHDDKNCRTFWRCEAGASVPACCDLYQRYVNGMCIDDVTCNEPCPLRNDATCSGFGVKSLDFPDGNCKTHFDCVNGMPHPVCCKDGERYDILSGVCLRDPTCRQPCPSEYVGICANLMMPSYSLLDGNCRTYMRCDGLGHDEPHCCRTGHMYDHQRMRCVSGTFPYECEYANCPSGYIEECPYESVLNNPFVFKNLDSHGGMLMNCPVGTFFNQTECRCAIDPAFYERAKNAGRGCEIAVHLVLPNLKNKGVAGAAILMIGDYGQGERGVGNMANQWAGRDGINIPYYGGQELPSFYLEIHFTPVGTSAQPQILLSSCFYDAAGLPSLELRLQTIQNNTNVMTVNLGNNLGGSLLQTTLQYQLGVPYVYRMIYDGQMVGTFLDRKDGAMVPIRDVRDFIGNIPIHRSGLRFAHCRYEQNVSSFLGTVDEIKFSKCVNDQMKNVLYPTPVVG